MKQRERHEHESARFNQVSGNQPRTISTTCFRATHIFDVQVCFGGEVVGGVPNGIRPGLDRL